MDDNDEFYPNCTLISECCGARPLGEVYFSQFSTLIVKNGACTEELTPEIFNDGICSSCKDHATFVQEAEEE